MRNIQVSNPPFVSVFSSYFSKVLCFFYGDLAKRVEVIIILHLTLLYNLQKKTLESLEIVVLEFFLKVSLHNNMSKLLI